MSGSDEVRQTSNARLKEWMDASNIDAIEFASIVGMSKVTVRDWIRGRFSPKRDVRREIERITGGYVKFDEWETVIVVAGEPVTPPKPKIERIPDFSGENLNIPAKQRIKQVVYNGEFYGGGSFSQMDRV